MKGSDNLLIFNSLSTVNSLTIIHERTWFPNVQILNLNKGITVTAISRAIFALHAMNYVEASTKMTLMRYDVTLQELIL